LVDAVTVDLARDSAHHGADHRYEADHEQERLQGEGYAYQAVAVC
jgi:hypothetical protein